VLNMGEQLAVAIGGTVASQLVLTWRSSAAQGLGRMMSAARRRAGLPEFRRRLANDEVNATTIRGVLQSQLIGALPSTVAVILCRVLGC
jgi:hypothetical protein